MAIELETQKMFANYFENEEGPARNGGAVGTVSSSRGTEAAVRRDSPHWGLPMSVITGLFYLLGLSGVIGGLLAIRSLAGLESADILMSRMANYGVSGPQSEMASAMLKSQLQYSSYLYLMLGVRILLGLACFGVGSLLVKRVKKSHKLAQLVLLLLIIYSLAELGVTYLTTSSLFDASPNSPETVDTMMMMAIGIALGIAFVKIGVYCGTSYYLTRPEVAALFETRQRQHTYSY